MEGMLQSGKKQAQFTLLRVWDQQWIKAKITIQPNFLGPLGSTHPRSAPGATPHPSYPTIKGYIGDARGVQTFCNEGQIW
ncbi:hypothetical protein XELAEV_18037443mg [Xenopus laevis]|uniref:Uncharacterized protein n=1 Tax=Xenopus laevis TaxID=8355 RepID=A0A974CDA7_XENLA|nr:hypothetical protein XELAEV_18037443mg [Xenopus laevis]